MALHKRNSFKSYVGYTVRLSHYRHKSETHCSYKYMHSQSCVTHHFSCSLKTLLMLKLCLNVSHIFSFQWTVLFPEQDDYATNCYMKLTDGWILVYKFNYYEFEIWNVYTRSNLYKQTQKCTYTFTFLIRHSYENFAQKITTPKKHN